MPSPVIIMVQGDQLNSEAIIISSPQRLGVGGRAILNRFNRSHQAAISGRAICSPRVNNIVRLCVRS